MRGPSIRSALTLIPLFALYLAIILVAQATPAHDEVRYLAYAANLLHGNWTPSDGLDLWYGPGYPLMLAPLVATDAPLVVARLLNALLLLGALLYFRATARLYVSDRAATWGTLALGLYPPLMRHLHMLMSEALAIFLVCGLAYHLCALLQRTEHRAAAALAASAFMAALAHTKPVYGYTILAGVAGYGILWVLRRRPCWRTLFLVHSLALGLCVPYLLHTWSVSGRPLYWSSAGGLAFYWMAASRGSDLGDWHDPADDEEMAAVASEHRATFAGLAGLGAVERDRLLWRSGMQRLTASPAAYARNWLANLGRLLFSYPFSHTPQKLSTTLYAVPNMFLVVFLVLGAVPALRRWRSVPAEIWALLGFAVVSLAGMSLVSAVARYLVPMVPLLALWIAFSADRLIMVRLADLTPQFDS